MHTPLRTKGIGFLASKIFHKSKTVLKDKLKASRLWNCCSRFFLLLLMLLVWFRCVSKILQTQEVRQLNIQCTLLIVTMNQFKEEEKGNRSA